MISFVKDHKQQCIIGMVAAVHTLLTLISDRGIFTFPDVSSSGYTAAIFDYSLCKILTCIVLYFIYTALWQLVSKNRKEHCVYDIVMCALPYLVVIIAVCFIKLPQGYLTNDESSILNDAMNLTHSTWFNVLTPYFFSVSLMILPFKYGPIIAKLIIEFLTVGYVVYRSKRYFGPKTGLIAYILFLLYPVIAYTTSAHRLPVYFLLYLILMVKFIFDYLEGHKITPGMIFLIILLGSVLTQWRTEGIYLAALVPILLFLVYPHLRNKKNVLMVLILSVIIQYAVSIPQNAFSGAQLSDAANDRMKPFWAYTITNMYRNGLDLNKNADDLAIVDKYLSLDAIAAINEHYGDINYEDVLILYQEGFVGVREDAGVTEFVNYSDALKRIFISNPDVFIRTRIGAFIYAALPYHVTFEGFGIKSLARFAFSLVKSLSYNLFIPLAIIVFVLIRSLAKRKWIDFFITGGLLAHWFIVFILAPASYFKYYFPIYIMAYWFVIMSIMWYLKSRFTAKKQSAE